MKVRRFIPSLERIERRELMNATPNVPYTEPMGPAYDGVLYDQLAPSTACEPAGAVMVPGDPSWNPAYYE